MEGDQTSLEITRNRFEAGILKTLYNLYFHDIRDSGVPEKRANTMAQEAMNEELVTLQFCHKSDVSKIQKVLPLIIRAINGRKRKRYPLSSEVVNAVAIMLYYGYVLSEQSEDSIPDMLTTLKEILSETDAQDVYTYIIRIASSECEHCSKLRRLYLFGIDFPKESAIQV